MNRASATKSATSAFSEITDELCGCGLCVEPYVVGPFGLGAFQRTVSGEVSAYVSFAHFSKYQALGAYIGFAFPELKSITDRCLLDVGRRLGIVPKYAIANPCPAVLFPLEFFVQSPEGQPFKLGGNVREWVRRVVCETVLNGSHAWVSDRRQLLLFLASDKAPFLWSTSDVPRRLVHVVYLVYELGWTIEAATKLVEAVNVPPGDADFDGIEGDLADAVFRHFYASELD